MNRILILFAHPAFEHSRVHKSLIETAATLEGILGIQETYGKETRQYFF